MHPLSKHKIKKRKSLELDTINPETIKQALSPEPNPIQIRSQSNIMLNTYKSLSLPW